MGTLPYRHVAIPQHAQKCFTPFWGAYTGNNGLSWFSTHSPPCSALFSIGGKDIDACRCWVHRNVYSLNPNLALLHRNFTISRHTWSVMLLAMLMTSKKEVILTWCNLLSAGTALWVPIELLELRDTPLNACCNTLACSKIRWIEYFRLHDVCILRSGVKC